MPIFRITAGRLEGESVTEALRRFGELQRLELPLPMSGGARGWDGCGSTAQGSSEVLLFSHPKESPSVEPVSCTFCPAGSPCSASERAQLGKHKRQHLHALLGISVTLRTLEPCLYHEKIDLGISCPCIRVHVMTSKISSLQKISCLRGQLLALLKTFQSLNSLLGCASPVQGPVPQVVTQSVQLLISSGALSASDQMLRSSQVARLIKSFSMTEWLSFLEIMAHRF